MSISLLITIFDRHLRPWVDLDTMQMDYRGPQNFIETWKPTEQEQTLLKRMREKRKQERNVQPLGAIQNREHNCTS